MGFFSDPFTMQYLEGDRAMLNCSDEYNETIQISSVLYNYSTCSHGDKYGIQNLCDGQRACSFNVTNSNVGSSCGADGKASLQVSYNCKRNGGWSNSTRNSTCSASCGEGVQLYTRSCTNPSPNEIGESCVGESYYEEVCYENNCVYTKIECTNTAFHWSCPGGYLQVYSALWTYFKIDGCIQTTSGSDPPTNVIKNVQNECENKTSCNFNVADFGVSCAGCSALIYVYKCVKVPWNSWEPWSNCSGSCVTGIQTRTRSCNSNTIECEGLSTETRNCDEKDCYYCGDQKFYNASLQLNTDSSNGTGYLLLDPVNTVHCCGQIAMWHYVPVETGNITFSVWRKIDVNRYKIVGTNTLVVKGKDVSKQTTYNVPETERILINTGDIIGWHDGGHNIIEYYDCLPSKKPCPTTILRTNMNSTNVGDEINVEYLPQQSSRIYTMSYTSTVKGPPQFGMTPDSVTIGYRKSVNSRVMGVQITDFGDFIRKIELDYDNEYYYFDTSLRSILVKKMLPHSTGQKITRHNYVLSVQDWCYNTATLTVTVTENIPPMIHGLPDMLGINGININPILTTFSVDDPSDNVTCMINKTTPHTDMFILSLHGNDASLILSENSGIDVSTTSEYVIKISCTDGTDTTFFNLTLLFTMDKPDTQSDTIPIIIGASIGGLFLIMVIIVICVRKRQQKKYR